LLLAALAFTTVFVYLATRFDSLTVFHWDLGSLASWSGSTPRAYLSLHPRMTMAWAPRP
jgi:hypothetical protein